MSNSIVMHPHVYKKGKVLNLKKLDEGTFQNSRKYCFSTNIGSLTTVINSLNNLNQITGRNWLNLSKLLSYFGLSKDISEKLSKKGNPSNFRKFFSDFKGGESTKDLAEIKRILQENIKRLEAIEEKLKPKSEGEQEVLQKLEDIHKGLKQVLGV